MVDEIIKRKPLKIDDTPDCYFHHERHNIVCKNCFCEHECMMEDGK
jgi:hypothetical protein